MSTESINSDHTEEFKKLDIPDSQSMKEFYLAAVKPNADSLQLLPDALKTPELFDAAMKSIKLSGDRIESISEFASRMKATLNNQENSAPRYRG